MNFASEPYYDDFDETKKFYKTLFRPGYAVQTRELNQIQSTLQNQINGVGKHLFKEGSVVVPGNVMYDNNMPYVKIQERNTSSSDILGSLQTLPKTLIVGQTSGVSALVVHYEISTATDPHTLYCNYLTSGPSSTRFIDGEVLLNEDGQEVAVAAISNATGHGTVAAISDGIYYINGFFVNVYYKYLVVSKYINYTHNASVQPTAKIGIVWADSIITSVDDESLLDNAQGTPNYSAPGADRYKIDTSFEIVDFANKPLQFVELVSVESGNATISQNQPKYNEIEKELAKRTYEESGDYVIDNFKVSTREYRKNFFPNWSASTNYIIGDVIQSEYLGTLYSFACIDSGVSGTIVPSFLIDHSHVSDGTVTWEFAEKFYINDGIFETNDDSKYIVEVDGGTASVQGYEYKSGGLVRLTNDKARDYDRSINTDVVVYDGTYIKVKNVFSIPATVGSDFVPVNLYNQFTGTPGTASGTKVGTAMIRWLEPDSGSSNYRMYLYDVQMLSGYVFEIHTKQIQSANGSGNNFTCDVVPVSAKASGSITSSGTAVVGVGTLFSQQLIVGDYITVDSINFHRVTVVANNNALTLATSLTTTGSVFYTATTAVVNNTSNSAVIGLSNTFIRKIKAADDASVNTEYVITRKLGTIISNGSGRVDMILSNPTEGFSSTANATNYMFVNNTTGAVQVPTTYTVNSTQSIYANGLSVSASYTVCASIIKTAVQRNKILNTATIDFTTSAAATIASLSLGKADCYRIVSVYQSPAFGNITSGNLASVECSNLFSFDSGQKSLYYDVGVINRINPQTKITGSVRVIFEYFSHSAGDYFSVDSYENVIPYYNIDPKLRDTLDFRPVKNDSGVGFNSSNVGILKSGYNINADYSYYTPRIDILAVTMDKKIVILKGISSSIPTAPTIPAGAMAIYIIGNLPYGNNPKKSVILSAVDNKRFTMRDIGNLENRISKLEYYTALTLMETQTTNLTITDDIGSDMFKNGFLVEPFNDHGLGLVSDIDYSCYINSSINQLYPQTNVISSGMSEVNTNDLQRTSQNYRINDGLITLPYTEVVYSSNEFASRVENVNPFAIASFNGNVSIYPSSDTWFDTLTLPTIYRSI